MTEARQPLWVDPVELTRKLVARQSVNPPGHEADCAALVGGLLEQAGFETHYYNFAPGRTSVVARLSRDDTSVRPLCMTGHLDTVPIGKATWSVDPFGAEIHEGRLYGRGSSDMKSGVAAMVAAAVAERTALRNGPGLLLVLTAGEETGCEGARHLSGLQGVLGRAGAMVVGEPTGNTLRTGHRGALWLKAVCHGRTAHGAMPHLGDNAIHKGAALITRLQDFGFNRAPHAQLGGASLNIGQVHGGQNINSVPDYVSISLDIRSTPDMPHKTICHELEHYLSPELAGLETVLDLPGIWTMPDEPWIQRWQGCKAEGSGADTASVPFFTDASILKPALGNIPTLILGPGETHMAHQVDEYCHVENIIQAVCLYRAIITDWQNNTYCLSKSQALPEPP